MLGSGDGPRRVVRPHLEGKQAVIVGAPCAVGHDEMRDEVRRAQIDLKPRVVAIGLGWHIDVLTELQFEPSCRRRRRTCSRRSCRSTCCSSRRRPERACWRRRLEACRAAAAWAAAARAAAAPAAGMAAATAAATATASARIRSATLPPPGAVPVVLVVQVGAHLAGLARVVGRVAGLPGGAPPQAYSVWQSTMQPQPVCNCGARTGCTQTRQGRRAGGMRRVTPSR